jgi:ATP-binding cassette subfamily B protein
MKLLLIYLRKHLNGVLFGLGMAFVNQFCQLLDPLILQRLLDKFAFTSHQGSWVNFVAQAAPGLAALIVTVFIAWLAKGFQLGGVQRVSHLVSTSMFFDCMQSHLRMPFASFEKRRSGESVDSLMRLRVDVQDLLKAFINTVFTSTISLLFVVIYTTWVAWPLAAFFLLIAPALAFASLKLSRHLANLDDEIYRRQATLSGNTTETLRNIEFVKSAGLTDQQLTRFDASSRAILRLELEKIKASRIFSFFHGACVHALRITLLVLLLYLRFTNKLTMGQFLSIFLYSFFIFNPMQEVGGLFVSYRGWEQSLRFVAELLHLDSEHRSAGSALKRLESLRFSEVDFRYAQRVKPAVRGISFTVQPGEIIAFVGPSGAGKTTLVKLISGLYPPSAGKILFNGISSNELDADALRIRMGLVTQDTQLFSGSIRENMLVIKPDASDDELLEKLAQSAFDGVLRRTPAGLDTVIGEGGLRLSGGERQRLSIARALLREPDLIIFDEATSSLDAITEREVADTFIGAAKARKIMAIVIAHRLSTVTHADRIYVLEGGSIVESGSHEELVRGAGLYARLWQQQVDPRHEEAEAWRAL